MIYAIPDEAVDLDKGYYHVVYVLLRFNIEDGIYINEDQTEMDTYFNEEEIEDVDLDDKMECHWRIVFEENEVGRDEEK